jgi:hypothetical protein
MSQDDRTPSSPDPAAEDDLSPVLPCLTSRQSSTRKTVQARRALANHPLTREYLDAGLRLIAGQFRPETRRPDDDDEWSKQSAFFDWLYAQKVIDEVSRGGKLRGNQGTFEDRWSYKDYYIQDLLSYALWVRHWAQHAAVAEEFAGPLTSGADFVQAVHEASYWSCRAQLSSTSSRVWLIASAVGERYPAMKTAMGKVHRGLNDSWLRLRPGVTINDVAEILSALSMGISLRIASDDHADLIDDERKQSLLGTAALAVLASCIDPGDGQSLEEIVRGLVHQRAEPAADRQAELTGA